MQIPFVQRPGGSTLGVSQSMDERPLWFDGLTTNGFINSLIKFNRRSNKNTLQKKLLRRYPVIFFPRVIFRRILQKFEPFTIISKLSDTISQYIDALPGDC